MDDTSRPNIGQIAVDVGEAVAAPIKDEVGKFIETGVQSVIGSTPKPIDPMEKQKRQAEELKKKQEANWVIERYQALDQAQAQVRQQQAQEIQKKQQEQQQKQQVKQYEIVQKQKQAINTQVREAQTKAEVKRGVGG